MGNPYEATFIDQNAEGRLVGEVNFTNPANQPGGSYSPPTGREQVNGNAVMINNGAAGLLTWDATAGPNTLIDRTTPSAPTIITTGVYAVTVSVMPASAMTAAGSYFFLFDLDLNGEDPEVGQQSPPASASASTPPVTQSLTYFLVAGAVLRARVTNLDGVQNLGFQLAQAVIQRLS